MIERNRITFAQLQIYRHADELFVCLCDLLDPRIEEAMNIASHDLTEAELKVVLYEMFSEYRLVALKEGRGLFTSTLKEIEAALHEEKDYLYESANTFYSLTTGGIEQLRKLKAAYLK